MGVYTFTGFSPTAFTAVSGGLFSNGSQFQLDRAPAPQICGDISRCFADPAMVQILHRIRAGITTSESL